MKEKTLAKLIAICTLVLGVAAFVMIFLDAVTTGGDNPVTYKGMDLAFGKMLGQGTLFGQSGERKIEFSFGTTVAYFLPLVAALLLGLTGLISKNKGLKFLMGVISFSAFVVSVVLLVLVRNMSIMTISTSGWIGSGASQGNFTGYGMAIGLILAIVFSALAACTAGTYTVLQLLKSNKKRKR